MNQKNNEKKDEGKRKEERLARWGGAELKKCLRECKEQNGTGWQKIKSLNQLGNKGTGNKTTDENLEPKEGEVNKVRHGSSKR